MSDAGAVRGSARHEPRPRGSGEHSMSWNSLGSSRSARDMPILRLRPGCVKRSLRCKSLLTQLYVHAMLAVRCVGRQGWPPHRTNRKGVCSSVFLAAGERRVIPGEWSNIGLFATN